MIEALERILGTVLSLKRYPVKSMLGEELDSTDVGISGLLGDRSYALIDSADGKVASAKNPRKWPNLFDFRAVLTEQPKAGASIPAVAITLPDGSILKHGTPDVDGVLSAALGRDVTLSAARSHSRSAEEYWPDIEGLDHRDAVTDFELPADTFFDSAFVHVLTTSTLKRLSELYPEGRFETARFRPNVVIETVDGNAEFAEDAWIGRKLAIGGAVLRIDGPCPRCVMTTLAQGDLPQDRGILRTAAQYHAANVGLYASVVQPGQIRRGDRVAFA